MQAGHYRAHPHNPLLSLWGHKSGGFYSRSIIIMNFKLACVAAKGLKEAGLQERGIKTQRHRFILLFRG